jgi:hypothetical protein
MIVSNCYISFQQNTGHTADGVLLSQINIYLDEPQGEDVKAGDVISDSGYNEYRVQGIVTKFNSQDFNVIVEDIRGITLGPFDGRGAVFTPTPKWSLGRVSADMDSNQVKAIYDETNREVIDENLGGVRETIYLYTITSDDALQGFIDITNLSPVPVSTTAFRLIVIGGIEQVNADVPGNAWGVTPDFQVKMTTDWKRVIFTNAGQPTVPLTGHLGVDDTVQFVYLYKS